MAVSPIEPIGPIQSMYSTLMIPLQDASGFSHIHRTEQLDYQGRTISITEVEVRTYDRFAKLETIPNPHKQSTISILV